jgi:hypothetical protein
MNGPLGSGQMRKRKYKVHILLIKGQRETPN